jgi:hypothetical protein
MGQRQRRKNITHRKAPNRLLPILMGISGLVLVVWATFALWGGNKPKTAIEVSGAPSLKVDNESIDLGDVQLGRTVEVSFLISNTGDQPLRFNKPPYIEVKEGC